MKPVVSALNAWTWYAPRSSPRTLVTKTANPVENPLHLAVPGPDAAVSGYKRPCSCRINSYAPSSFYYR